MTDTKKMSRPEAIKIIINELSDTDAMIHANGAISRESFSVADRGGNFYLAGSMGLPAAVGLGLALSQPRKRVIVLDGDGNVLMGLGNLALVGALKPTNLIHMVLDNGVYATTGGQATLSPELPLELMAFASGYSHAFKISDPEILAGKFRAALHTPGPHFLRIMISSETPPPVPRIPRTCEQIKKRFICFCQN